MTILLPLVYGLLALCAEVLLRTAFAADTWAPDLLTVVLIWIGAHRSLVGGAIVAAILGALADGFAGSPLGVHMLHALLLFYAAAILADQVRFHGVVGNVLMGLAGGFVGLFLLALISRLLLGDTTLAARIGDLLVPRVAVVAIAAPILFPVLDRLDGLFTRRPDGDLL
ncbi:MAG: rod shape-determining protein MreD [bacterium]|nr:rod shape-determining protein MreD [Myxococcales bacterium]MCB9551162.1 rod shape-determining protein MreD [Myxococcales bacterium]